MAALTAGITPIRRGTPATRNEFGAVIPAGEKVFRGSLLAWTAAGKLVRIQTSGAVAFAGMCDRDLDNSASSADSATKVVAHKGTWGLTVPSATTGSVLAAVYATDDGTLTLSSAGSPLQVGTLAGIESGQTYVSLLG